MKLKYAYVLSCLGRPLMPTKNLAKVRMLLKNGKAKVVKRTPFTIMLLYQTNSYVQDITLGVDTGSREIGMSAVSNGKEIYSSVVKLRNDITGLISDKSSLRRIRRNRNTRYRPKRVLNRSNAKTKGWLSPSVKQKINTHLTVIRNVYKILPISKLIVETAAFDIAKMNKTNVSESKDKFWNTRSYVFYRDNYTCQYCKGRSKDKVLTVHHIVTRKVGGNSKNNLVTLCKTCHENYHSGKIKLPFNNITLFKDPVFMGIMRTQVFSCLKNEFKEVKETFGYITKDIRITNNLPKEHYIDARCITGYPLSEPLGYYFYQRKYRCHNRKIHQTKYSKGGIRKKAQASYTIFGYRLFDKIRYKGHEYRISGRYSNGFYMLNDLYGNYTHKTPGYKKIKLIEKAKTYITETYEQKIL